MISRRNFLVSASSFGLGMVSLAGLGQDFVIPEMDWTEESKKLKLAKSRWQVAMTSFVGCTSCLEWIDKNRVPLAEEGLIWGDQEDGDVFKIDQADARERWPKAAEYFDSHNLEANPLEVAPGWLLLVDGSPLWLQGKRGLYPANLKPSSAYSAKTIASWISGRRLDDGSFRTVYNSSIKEPARTSAPLGELKKGGWEETLVWSTPEKKIKRISKLKLGKSRGVNGSVYNHLVGGHQVGAEYVRGKPLGRVGDQHPRSLYGIHNLIHQGLIVRRHERFLEQKLGIV